MLHFEDEVSVSKTLVENLKYFSRFEYETGGILFGFKDNYRTKILSFSFKRGTRNQISFLKDDYCLFYPPKDMILLGTWHTHPLQKELKSSFIDLNQWSKWNCDYYHIILNKSCLILYKNTKEVHKYEL